jgi:hypothetical protein
VTDQFTAPFVELPTLAVNGWVEEGHPALFGHRLAAVGAIPIVTGALPPPPHATRTPIKMNDKNIPMEAGFEIRRPARPTTKSPVTGIVKGIHGYRLSARFRRLAPAGAWFGPAVLMVRLTVCVPDVPAAIEVGEKTQVLVGSIPAHENVTAAVNVPAGTVGATVKEYPVAGMPAKTVAAVVPLLTRLKSGAMTLTVAGVTVVEGAL